MSKPLRIVSSIFVFAAVVFAALCLVPVPIPRLAPPKKPPLPFQDAKSRAMREASNPPAKVNPVCLETLLDHGHRTRRAIVLLHGISNCPAQYAKLAAELHAMGHTVWIPRMPFHGFRDRLTPDYGRLNLERLAAWVDDTLEIAGGLGEEIVVAGLSVNGVTAAWIAQHRADVSRTLVIAPFLLPAGMPEWLGIPVARVLSRSPNFFVWWDPELREHNPGPPHAYPRFPTRVLASFMVLGTEVLSAARSTPPACTQIALIGSDSDTAIDIPTAKLLAAEWRRWPEVRVIETWFPASAAVPHDMIDPLQPDAATEVSYPVLLSLLGSPLDAWE